MRTLGFLLLALILTSCDSPKPAARAEAPVAPVRNDAVMLLADNQISTRVVQDHVLGEKILPGGTVGDYENKGRKYQLFLIRTEGNQQAALLLLSAKSLIDHPEYIAHMGGYAGNYMGAPIYIYAKLQFLAGVVGLPKDEADSVARHFASRIR